MFYVPMCNFQGKRLKRRREKGGNCGKKKVKPSKGIRREGVDVMKQGSAREGKDGPVFD